MTASAKETKKVLARYLDGVETATSRIEAIRQRLDEIKDQFGEILADAPGEVTPEAKALMAERGDLADELSEMLTVRAALEEKAEAARADLGRAAAEELIQRARKTAGGLVGEHPRHVERAEEHERKARESREKADAAASRSWQARWAVQAVARLLDVEAGEISTVPGVTPPRSPIRSFLSLGKLRKAGREAIRFLDSENLLTDEARDAIEAAIAELDDKEEAARRSEEVKARRDETEQAREEGRDRVDAWLRDLLANGPVPRDRIYAAARANGIAISPKAPGGRHGANLHSATRERRSVEVEVLERIEDDARPRPVWWGLAGSWDDEAFRRVGSGSGTLAGAR